MKVRWLRQALRNLDIHHYIRENNPEAALRVVTKIPSGVNQLEKFPLIGRAGRVPGIRELVISNSPYVVVYRLKGDAVEVLRVLHSAKQFPE